MFPEFGPKSEPRAATGVLTGRTTSLGKPVTESWDRPEPEGWMRSSGTAGLTGPLAFGVDRVMGSPHPLGFQPVPGHWVPRDPAVETCEASLVWDITPEEPLTSTETPGRECCGGRRFS